MKLFENRINNLYLLAYPIRPEEIIKIVSVWARETTDQLRSCTAKWYVFVNYTHVE